MSAGQSVLTRSFDVARFDAAEGALGNLERARGQVHVGQLRQALVVLDEHRKVGMALSTVAAVAAMLRCSERRASGLVEHAQQLSLLSGAFAALTEAVMTVEQSAVVAEQLAHVPIELRLSLWERTLARLRADLDGGIVRPPARLRTLLARWVIEATPSDATDRRRSVEAAGHVDYRRRDFGVGDLLLNGITQPNLRAILGRLVARSAPIGSEDPRSAGKRRLDAAVDLLLGRESLPLDDEGHCRPGCGCGVGAPVPCGTDVQVLVPLGAALGTTDETATLADHEPLDPDLLAQLLLSAPRLRPVWVDEHGVPVAVGEKVTVPARDDPAALRAALLNLAHSPPGPAQPRHPHDHPPDPCRDVLGNAALGRSTSDSQAHPPARSGPYRVPARLRRLLGVRRPLCEWPGCGSRAVRCDLDHDVAWPDGPTCGCNLGPLCRRHHRIKQQGWTKTRTPDAGVRWTHPTGRTWTSPTPHEPPAAGVRPLPPITGPDELDQLGPLAREAELWHLGMLPDDPDPLGLRADDIEPEQADTVGDLLRSPEARWSIDLADLDAWADDYAT